VPNCLLWTPLRSAQLFNRLQLPFLIGVLLVSTATAIAVPSLWTTPALVAGVALTLAASALFVWPQHRWLLTAWVVVVPLIDILAIAFVRAALYPYLPSVGMLCLLPFAWIAYRFRWPGLIVIFGSGVFISVLPFALGGQAVTSFLALLNVITLPVIATGISLAIHLGAMSFKRGRDRTEAATSQLHDALERTRDDELLLRSVLDTVTSAVAFYDSRDRLVFSNSAAEKLLRGAGFRLDTPPHSGPNVLRADRKTPIPPDEQLIPRALRGEVIASHVEWVGEPGDQIAILASARRVHRENGQLFGTLIAAYDVTELANAIEVREEFLTTVSHELRTPLTSVIGYTEELIDMLGDDASRPEIAQALDAISRNGEVLLERVSQLLTAGNKRIELVLEAVDVATLVAQTTEVVTPQARQAGIELVTDLEPSVVAQLDPRRVTQAVENLLTNAVKFTGPGGVVTVTAKADGDGHVVIEVSDTGIGMTADEKRRVFDRFYRAKTVRRNAIQGIGVGLSIVKSIVGAHQGEITVESEQGSGTRISLCFPLTQGERVLPVFEPDQPSATPPPAANVSA